MIALLAGVLVLSGCPDDENNDPDPQPVADMAKTDMPVADMPVADMPVADMPADMTPVVDLGTDQGTDLCVNVTCETPAPTCDGNTVVNTMSACNPANGMCEATGTPVRMDCTGDTPVCSAGTCVADGVVDPDPTCENYCDTVMANCTGENVQFGSNAECLDYCGNVGGWEDGTKGDTDGDTIACRIYHGNAPAMSDPALHCDHAGPTGGNVCGSWCDVYCNLGFEHCEGPNELYPTAAACQTACGGISDAGEPGDIEFDTIQCRIYHLGAPAQSAPATHCSHGAVPATDFCVGNADDFVFATDAPSAYTRHDRIGMPAVSTALVTDKLGYNDQDPIDDAAMNNPFVGEIVGNLTGLHMALDDDLMTAGLTPCSMTTTTNGLPTCVGQRVAQGGPIVANLVIPDHISINPDAAAGFPNGRLLADPVIDVTLAIILLDMSAHTPTTLAGLPLNPPRNDRGVEGAFLTTFPYLHPPHTP